MEKKYLKNPDLLLELGFKDISEPSTDFVRTVLFEKEVRKTGIRVRAEFTRYISDDPGGSYSVNNEYNFERFYLSTSSIEDCDFCTINISTVRELKLLISLL